ncbi:MAG: hypothetical protein M0T72_12115 [Candidatus Dormibacteraeota bacterium]|nr:hypothetical protein [Candidatus Dormibacteraeota bacterium]
MTRSNREDPAWLRPQPSRFPSSASKTTVYLGADLMARIYELRGRGIDINVSRVCQLALEQAIAEASQFAPPPPPE